jgi:hypothetical protein
MHGMGVALVVVIVIAKPDLSHRSDPPWLDEVCARYDICAEPAGTPSPAR